MDINSSHLSFFKAETSEHAILCMESFYSTDYCPLETKQTPLSKPHLRPQASVKPKGDSSPIKIPLLFPVCNIYFPWHSKFISAKTLRPPGLSRAGRCKLWTGWRVKIFLDGNRLRNVPRNKRKPWCFQGQNYPFYALFLMCCPDWKCDRFLFVGVVRNEMRRALLLRAATIPLPLSNRLCHESGYILLFL